MSASPNRFRAACASAAFLLWGIAGPRAAGAWEIRRFATHLEVLPDSRLEVSETIAVDFDGEARHGIYRDLPVDYYDRFGQRLRLRWELILVADGAGHDQPYHLSRVGRYQRVRIGDPDVTVSGQQTYVLHYRVARAVSRFADHGELFWNVTGTEWAVPIRQAVATIRLPARIAAQDIRATAFTGAFGSREQAATVTVGEGPSVRIEGTRPLGPYEGLTVVVGWPPGVTQPPPWWRELDWWFTDNWGYGLPLLVLVWMLDRWRRRGKEYPGRGSIAVEYEPPNGLRPAEVGALIDDRVDLRDITATVVDLAVRGHLQIEPIGKSLLGRPEDYQFIRRSPSTKTVEALRRHEQILLRELFGGEGAAGADRRLLSDLETKFYDELPAIRDAIYAQLVDGGYWDGSPERVRSRYVGLAVAVVVVGVLGGVGLRGLGDGLVPSSYWIGVGASAVIVGWVGHYMPRKTRKGRLTLDRIRGFDEFLTRTDRERLTRMDAATLFEQMLPFAMALGVAQQWAAAFEGLYRTPPSWYVTGAGGPGDFSPRLFARQMDVAAQRMGTTFVSVPRTSASSGSSGFGGGGSSGGGFGGGGGGAW